MANVAMIVGKMFEDSEFRVPYDRLRKAGHQVDVIGVEAGASLRGKQGEEEVETETAIEQASADDYDALVIPGGYSPDDLRTNEAMVRLTRKMFMAGKPVAAICHAGSMLVEADIAKEHELTSWPSIKTDLENAGARWIDHEVVEDGNLITSRHPGDLEAFCNAVLRQLEESKQRSEAS